MSVLTLAPYKPVPGTVGDANAIANAMTTIESVVNALDNNNFAAGKIFDLTKLMQGGAVDGQFLGYDAGAANWTATRTIRSNAIGTVAFIIKAFAGQTADLVQWQDSGSNPLASVTAAGKLQFGGDTVATLYRLAAGVIKTDGNVFATSFLGRPAAAGIGISVATNTDATNRWQVLADGTNGWGPNGGAIDTTLSRVALAQLQTENLKLTGGNLYFPNNQLYEYSATMLHTNNNLFVNNIGVNITAANTNGVQAGKKIAIVDVNGAVQGWVQLYTG